MSDSLHRLSAALEGRYRIERELGAGGMATVYLAEDVKHHRKVAVKVLRPELAAILGAERFLKEIEVTANLQHPNILPLYDSGEADTLLYYVMPYVEGESLRDRLQRERQLGVEDALAIAKGVASALHFAHGHGVVHRDIKPENILLQSGQPLVADFGIALAISQAGGTRLTETGLSLGTPHYMSPEQATGDRELDARSDVYSLGAVVYEMLVGEPPHVGNSVQAVLARILSDTPPPVRRTRQLVPVHVDAAVQRALAKTPADRFASAADFATALSTPGFALAPEPERAVAAGGESWKRRAWIASGAAAIFALLFVGSMLLRPAADAPGNVVRFAFAMGRPGDQPSVSISRDGQRILMIDRDSNGVARVVMRDLASMETVTIAGTEGAGSPFFSPEGDWIGFLTGFRLRIVPVGGGPATDILNGAFFGHWSDDGYIYAGAPYGGVVRLRATGGPVDTLTTPDTARRELGHWSPETLPGGKAVLFTSYATPLERSRIEAVDIRSRRRTVLVEGAIFGRYARSGHLLFVRDGAVFAVRFDARRLRVLGAPVPLIPSVAWRLSDGVAGFDLADNGTMVYLDGPTWDVDAEVLLVGRDGAGQRALPQPGPFMEPRFAPDGRRIVLTVARPNRNLWLYDPAREALTQITRSPAAAFGAQWIDNRSVAFVLENPVYDLYRVAVDGSTPEQPVVVGPWDKLLTSVSTTGRDIAYQEHSPASSLRIASLDGGNAPRPFGDSLIQAWRPAISPDGRWIAYEAGDPDRPDVFVRAADGGGGRIQVSVGGGAEARWTRGGREIIYRRGPALLAVSFDAVSGDVGAPVTLFSRPGVTSGGPTLSYDVTPDGNRFLIVQPVERPGALPVVIVLNAFRELERRVR